MRGTAFRMAAGLPDTVASGRSRTRARHDGRAPAATGGTGLDRCPRLRNRLRASRRAPRPAAAAKFLDLAPMRARPGPHFDRSRRIVDGHLGDHLRMLVPTSQTLASWALPGPTRDQPDPAEIIGGESAALQQVPNRGALDRRVPDHPLPERPAPHDGEPDDRRRRLGPGFTRQAPVSHSSPQAWLVAAVRCTRSHPPQALETTLPKPCGQGIARRVAVNDIFSGPRTFASLR